MNFDISAEFPKVPQSPRGATKHVLELLLHQVCPLLQKLRAKLQCYVDYETEDEIIKIKNVFMLCSSQIKKCVVNFLDIIKMENKEEIYLRESRQFIFERLSWCITKLTAVEKNIDACKLRENVRQDPSEDPMFATPMYFVNWIDYTFEVLGKLSEDVYRTDYKNDNMLYEEWKATMVEHVTTLHMCIDELLLSAMTLCKYCLPQDQTILKARCQVVLRETRVLFGELITEDISAAVKVTKAKLKLPIMPSNVNMMIDVLKDVLYVLETNTNTALLALLIHCYVNCASPVDVLQDHFNKREGHFCSCCNSSFTDMENCTVVTDFDLYNERLQQIGSFAVSCSSDQKRILTLKSCLSSLESLDPHLVPSMTTSPSGYHSELLANFWKQEVMEIRNTVFLIVDPVAFVEKCKQYMHDLLLEMRQQDRYDNRDLWVVMCTGRMVHDFFSIYKKYEPDAIAQHDELDMLLDNLNRAQKECKTVSEFFTSPGTFLYEPNMKYHHCDITFNSFVTRVKLLYTMVKRVHELIRPKDSDEQMFGEEEVVINKHLTHTININTDTYTNCQRKPEPNFTRSVFARTGVKTSTKNVFLSKLTKHLESKIGAQEELNFSAQVSELFKMKEERKLPAGNMVAGNFSLRKAVLTNQRDFPFMKKIEKTFYEDIYGDENDEKDNRERVFEGTESLQISEILSQINNVTSVLSSSALPPKGFSRTKADSLKADVSGRGLAEDSASTSNLSNATQPSNFTTLERLSDLDLVESKLNSLRANSDFETHL